MEAPQQMIGESPAFLDMMDKASRLAEADRPVLVMGERGSGKELVAARLHRLSPRWSEPYVSLNCASLTETLLESELFGAEAGAYTGANKRRIGRFERADRGTLFLDEIGTLSANAQEKLLRVIEYGEFERLGGETTLSADVRLIGATNENLPKAAAEGRFRADLLDRLAFDVVLVPPLRARLEDIMPLARHFAREFGAELGRDHTTLFSQQAQAQLLAHDWPGNVRELKNVVERAVFYADEGEVEAVTLDPFRAEFGAMRALSGADDASGPDAKPEEALLSTGPFDLKQRVGDYERRLVETAFQACGGHQGKTADHLGLSYDQARHLLKKYGIGPFAQRSR